MKLSTRELTTVLAALRYMQGDMEEKGEETVTSDLSHIDNVEPLSLEEIDDLCERLNCSDASVIEDASETEVERFTMTLKDWRFIDGEDLSNVPASLQEDYAVTVSKGSYDNLVLEMKAPTGDQSMVRIEAENGHFKLLVYCPDKQDEGEIRDDVDAICRITSDGMIVYGNGGYSPGLVLDGDHFTKVSAHQLQQMMGVLDGSSENAVNERRVAYL